ncbi:insulinase family protein [Dickeya dianthicola]|uniref:M16 family metallopeptidase n=1 Tax=Dickeya dianthicola TaxID=204039 RepID=UPI00136E1D04|nr:pitrilysin family protein [Dickeya dianthicola]MCI4236608.1 insulinase family protein [Dickeya dianthicola]MCI4254791.1 insulinase family protein [Dickeya dianthicola]MZG21615.1 insulinase family protein [Dickeya dianthicola]MZI88451.1 insulinase family protein [Dickeya dianthicola]
MQGTKFGLFVGGVLLAAAVGNVQAEALQPDPAWQQGKLDNGFSWQLLATPQRPSDRIELRLMINTGSLTENAQQTGFSHFISRLALLPRDTFSAGQLPSLWQQSESEIRPLPPATTSYDFTSYNLSLPNNRPDLLKDALSWLADTAGQLQINDKRIASATKMIDPVATAPTNPQDPSWRYRLKGSSLLSYAPGQPLKASVNAEQLSKYYKTWYTPDVMTLYVVGNVDSRAIGEQIDRVFSPLQGKRVTPSPLPTLSAMPSAPISLMDSSVKQDILSLVWDMPWQPIRDSQALARYWHSDLAREALFWHMQQVLTKSPLKDTNVRFDCNVVYGRAQCAIHLDNVTSESAQAGVTFLSKELLVLRDKGLSQAEFDTLMARKTEELSKLFATYARASTDILMDQRLRSQKNGVVDIAPEQYQKLRQNYLSSVTLEMLNQELHQQLSQEATLVMLQPQGEPEANMKALRETYMSIMQPDNGTASAALAQ